MRTRLFLATVSSLVMISVAAYASQHDDHVPANDTDDAAAVVEVANDNADVAVVETAAVETVVAEDVVVDVVVEDAASVDVEVTTEVVTDEAVADEVVVDVQVEAEASDEVVTEVAEEPAH